MDTDCRGMNGEGALPQANISIDCYTEDFGSVFYVNRDVDAGYVYNAQLPRHDIVIYTQRTS